MTTRTRTATSHYDVQKKRRSDELEYWRQNRLHLVKGSEVVMHPTPRGIDRGVLVGMDGDRPSLVLDAHRHEIAPGAVSTVHRHSWDAIMFVTSGRGWTEVNGRRYEWRAWDTVFLPAWAWHRHGNEGDTPATYVTFGSEPLAELVGMAIIEEGGEAGFKELPPPPAVASPGMGSDPYTRRIERLARRQESFSETRIMTAFDDINFRVTPRGARSGFLIDRSIGYRTGGLTAVMHQLAPGLYQSQHRHGGEAWLYCTTGRGYSVIDGTSTSTPPIPRSRPLSGSTISTASTWGCVPCWIRCPSSRNPPSWTRPISQTWSGPLPTPVDPSERTGRFREGRSPPGPIRFPALARTPTAGLGAVVGSHCGSPGSQTAAP